MANNPAGRLHALLVALQAPNNEIMQKVWAGVLEADESDIGEILSGLAIVLQQVAVAKERIEAVEDLDHDLYLRPLRQVEKTLDQINLGEQFSAFRNRLGPNSSGSLRSRVSFCGASILKVN